MTSTQRSAAKRRLRRMEERENGVVKRKPPMPLVTIDGRTLPAFVFATSPRYAKRFRASSQPFEM